MGGKNHQPCRIYLANSTALSRYLSIARAELEFGNVCLEDVLLCELQDRNGDAAAIARHFQASLDALDGGLGVLGKLRQQMLANHYEELPSFRTLDLPALGHTLTNMGLVSLPSWNRVVEKRCREGFEGLLSYFEDLLKEISGLTKILADEIRSAAQMGELTPLLEENRPGNFKADFGRLYTIYHLLESDFLASSILSTELWYSFTGRGSLTGESVLRKIA